MCIRDRLWAALGLGAWSCRSALTADGIAAWTPGQSWLAALALLGLYALKGLTAAFPSTALAAAAGLVLPFPLALGTNLCGAAAAQAGVSDITQKKDVLRFQMAVFRPEAVVKVCGLNKYRQRLSVAAGEDPALKLKLKPGADALESAMELVEDLKLQTQA